MVADWEAVATLIQGLGADAEASGSAAGAETGGAESGGTESAGTEAAGALARAVPGAFWGVETRAVPPLVEAGELVLIRRP